MLTIALSLGIAASLQAQDSSPTPLPSSAHTRFDEEVKFFSLEHRPPGQIDSSDAAVISQRERDIRRKAEFYGFDLSSGPWSYEQSICPMTPAHVMLQYVSKAGTEAESRFTVLVPRSGGRIWLIPVLSNGATRFVPAPGDPRNFRLFSTVVPRDLAIQNSTSEGRWLTLSICYAEMTGGWAQVASNPQSDLHMIKAPQPTLRIGVGNKEHQVQFTQPISLDEYRLWDITYSGNGDIVAASDEQRPFGQRVILHPEEPKPVTKPFPAEPVPVIKPQPPDPPSKVTPFSPAPK